MNSKHYQNVIIADKDIIFTSIIANNDIFKLSKQTLAILTPEMAWFQRGRLLKLRKVAHAKNSEFAICLKINKINKIK